MPRPSRLPLFALLLATPALAGDPGAPPPAAAPATPAAAATPAPATVTGTLEATLVSGDSHTVKLKITGGQTPPPGATGSLSKWVSTTIFGADVTMWLGIANGTVKSVDGVIVTLTVTEVTFDATVNDKKVNPFDAGAKSQLEWTK